MKLETAPNVNAYTNLLRIYPKERASPLLAFSTNRFLPRYSCIFLFKRWYSSPNILTSLRPFCVDVSTLMFFNARIFLAMASMLDSSIPIMSRMDFGFVTLNLSISFLHRVMASASFFVCWSLSDVVLAYRLCRISNMRSFFCASSMSFVGMRKVLSRRKVAKFVVCSLNNRVRSAIFSFCLRNSSEFNSISLRSSFNNFISSPNLPMVLSLKFFFPPPLPIALDWAANMASNDADMFRHASFIRSTLTFCVTAKSFIASFILSKPFTNSLAMSSVRVPTKLTKSLIDFSSSFLSS